jgi:hypothetical protein
MSDTKMHNDYDREKKVHRVEKQKSKVAKHKKYLYNMLSKDNLDDEFDDLYDDTFFNTKIKRR